MRALALTLLAGCAARDGTVVGRIVASPPFPAPSTFSFQSRTYEDRSLRVDAAGGVADAAVFIEGTSSSWISGKVEMSFGPKQFEPRVAFVSPGQAVDIGDTRDDASHELVVNLKGLESGDDRIHTRPNLPMRGGAPDRVLFRCAGDAWTREGKMLVRGRRVEVSFDRPALVPLDWD